MAKLYFEYGAMNSGKSTSLMQVAHNYEEGNMKVLLLKPGVDTKAGKKISSRIGLEREVDFIVGPDVNLFTLFKEQAEPYNCVLVDEAQFLTPEQVDQLMEIVAVLNVPVMCFGLRADFRTQGFPGSIRLLEIAHELVELKTICRCGRKAIFNTRKVNGKFTFSGSQVAIDGEGEVTYESLCAHCYFDKRRKWEKINGILK